MKGIIIASHGPMAEGILRSSQFFFGKQAQLQACCLDFDEDHETYTERLKKAIREVNDKDGVIVFCDLCFGVPCDCLSRIVAEEKQIRIDVITAVNMPMILQALILRQYTDVTVEDLMQIGHESINDLKTLIYKNKET